MFLATQNSVTPYVSRPPQNSVNTQFNSSSRNYSYSIMCPAKTTKGLSLKNKVSSTRKSNSVTRNAQRRSEPTSTLSELRTYFQSKRKIAKPPRTKGVAHTLTRTSKGKAKLSTNSQDETKLVQVRRTLPVTFQRQLIQLYYGSSTHFTQPNMTKGELARIFNIAYTTI